MLLINPLFQPLSSGKSQKEEKRGKKLRKIHWQWQKSKKSALCRFAGCQLLARNKGMQKREPPAVNFAKRAQKGKRRIGDGKILLCFVVTKASGQFFVRRLGSLKAAILARGRNFASVRARRQADFLRNAN